MSLTRIEAIDEMYTMFKTAWDATTYADRVKYENVANKSLPPNDQDPWVRVSIRHGASFQATLSGSVGTRRFTRTGFITAQLFEPAGVGLPDTADLAKIIQDAYEGMTSPGGVLFREVQINEIGPDGSWFQTNITANFEYDEVK